jgi:hypothetical protein
MFIKSEDIPFRFTAVVGSELPSSPSFWGVMLENFDCETGAGGRAVIEIIIYEMKKPPFTMFMSSTERQTIYKASTKLQRRTTHCTMLRLARSLRLPPSFLRYRCYSTSPVPAETLVTPEIEKADRTKEVELRTMQAPNRSKTWAPSQRPRSDAFNQPRFEGAILEMQVYHLCAREISMGLASSGSCN